MNASVELSKIQAIQHKVTQASELAAGLDCLPERKKELIDRLQNILNDLASDEIALKDILNDTI